MIFEIVHGRTFFSLASYLFSLVQGFMYCVQYMKPCVQYFSIIFFVLHIILSAVYEKNRYTMYHGMNMENINDWGECHCSCSFVASGQKCLISYLKDISGLTHWRFVLFFCSVIALSNKGENEFDFHTWILLSSFGEFFLLFVKSLAHVIT